MLSRVFFPLYDHIHYRDFVSELRRPGTGNRVLGPRYELRYRSHTTVAYKMQSDPHEGHNSIYFANPLHI